MKMTKLELFCPKCGVRGLWQDEADPGDYYAGTPMWCFACRSQLSDITIADPDDPRQGELGRAFSMRQFDAMRAAALEVAGGDLTPTPTTPIAFAIAFIHASAELRLSRAETRSLLERLQHVKVEDVAKDLDEIGEEMRRVLWLVRRSRGQTSELMNGLNPENFETSCAFEDGQ